ncbi:MAG: MFS transporter [Bacteroidota bacterium]
MAELQPLKTARTAVALIFAINGFIYASWASRLPRLTEMYQMSDADLSTVLLSIAVGALVAMPITGIIIVRVGSQRLTALTSIGFVITTLLLLHSPSYGLMMGIGFLLGMCNGSMDIAMNAQAIIVEDGLKKPIMSSFHAIFSAGMLLGAGGAYLFSSLYIDLRTHLLIAGSVGLMGLIWAGQQLLEDPHQRKAGDKSPGGWKLQPGLLLIGFVAFCCMVGEGAMSEWTSLFLEEVTGATKNVATIGVATFSGAMMMGRFGGDWARATFGSRILVRGGAIIAFSGLLLGLLVPHWLVSSFGFLLVGIGLSNIVPIAYSVAGKYPGIPAGVGISTVSVIGYAGFLIGPVAIGYISDYQKGQLLEFGSSWLGDWAGLQLGLGVVLLLFLLMLIVAFGFLKIKDA